MSRSNRRELLKITAAAGSASGLTWALVGSRPADRTQRRTAGNGSDNWTADSETEPPSQTRTSDPERVAGVHYVPPREGVAGIQRVIDQHAPDVLVQLGAGVYSGAELTLGHRVSLRGVGRDATTIRLDDGAHTTLVSSSGPGTEGDMMVKLQDITFDGNKDNNAEGDIVYGSFWNGRFVDCDFIEAPNVGFWLAGSSGGSTDDNHFRGCRFLRAGDDGVRIGQTREAGPAVGVARLDTCWFGTNAGRAVYLRGNDNVVTNGKFYSNGGTDILVDRGERNDIVHNDISKEVSDAPCVGIRSAKGVVSTRNRVTGNRIFGSYRDAVYAEASGNDVVGLQVHDNNIRGATKSDDETGYGIRAVGSEYVACTARDNTIVGGFSGAPIDVPSSWSRSDNLL